MLVTFEGIEGSGKSTQIDLLANRLSSSTGTLVPIKTSEPGSTALGKSLRKLILEPKNETLKPYPLSELFLYMADRAQHMEWIGKFLDQKFLVLCDRFTDSTVAYQGYGRGLDIATIHKLNEIASKGFRPDLTILLDLEVEVGLKRVTKRGKKDQIELERLEFHQRVRDGYLKLYATEPDRIVLIDANRPTEAIAEEIYQIVTSKLRLYP